MGSNAHIDIELIKSLNLSQVSYSPLDDDQRLFDPEFAASPTKVIAVVVIIISGMIFIVAIIRYRYVCGTIKQKIDQQNQ